MSSVVVVSGGGPFLGLVSSLSDIVDWIVMEDGKWETGRMRVLWRDGISYQDQNQNQNLNQARGCSLKLVMTQRGKTSVIVCGPFHVSKGWTPLSFLRSPCGTADECPTCTEETPGTVVSARCL